MGYEEHRSQAPVSVDCAVVTVSDSRTEATDESGKLLADGLRSAGHQVLDYALLPNDKAAVKTHLERLLENLGVQAIICSGGTGLSHRDITVDVASTLLEKTLPGFGELFRQLTYAELGTASIMSRTIAGVAKGKVIICLPGAAAAVGLALEKIILPELGHLVREASR